MSDPSGPLQVAVVKALKDSSALTALLNKRVYDSVSSTAVMPYISIGPSQVLPDKADCIDGTEISVQIDAWSRTNTNEQIKQIGAAIVATLDDQPLTVAGYTAVVFEIEAARYLIDPDGSTRHAALTFHALMQAA